MPGVNSMMGRMNMNLFSLGIGGEVLYSFIIILCSLLIYFGTREIYELSSYKGLKYFRQAFLFFSIAYFFRTFIKFIVLYFGVTGVIEFSPITFGATGLVTQLAFVYFSTMSIFYLLYSVMWKNWDGRNSIIYILHGLSLGIALTSILFVNTLWYLILNLFLLGIVFFVAYVSYKNRKNKQRGQGLYIIYALLLLFWVLNILDALMPWVFRGFQIFVYLASTGIFLFILYRVVRKMGSS